MAGQRRQLGLRQHERDQRRAGDADGDQLAAAPLALREPMRAYGVSPLPIRQRLISDNSIVADDADQDTGGEGKVKVKLPRRM